jgi:hypothetical protein
MTDTRPLVPGLIAAFLFLAPSSRADEPAPNPSERVELRAMLGTEALVTSALGPRLLAAPRFPDYVRTEWREHKSRGLMIGGIVLGSVGVGFLVAGSFLVDVSTNSGSSGGEPNFTPILVLPGALLIIAGTGMLAGGIAMAVIGGRPAYVTVTAKPGGAGLRVAF